MAADETRTFPILDAITDTLRGRGLSSRRVTSPIVTSSLGVGTRGGIVTPSEMKSSATGNGQLPGGSNASSRLVTRSLSSAAASPPSSCSSSMDVRREPAAANGSTRASSNCNGEQTYKNKHRRFLTNGGTVLSVGDLCSECCNASGRLHLNHQRHQRLRHDHRQHLHDQLPRQSHSSTGLKNACADDGCCRVAECRNGDGVLRRGRRHTGGVSAARCQGNGPCCCNAVNGDCYYCAAGEAHGQCCVGDRLRCSRPHHGNGVVLADYHHHDNHHTDARCSAGVFGNGQLPNGNSAGGGYDEDHVVWDDEDLDNGRLLVDECLMAGSDEIDDEDNAVDGSMDYRLAGTTMYDMSALPWDMMAKWCRYTALANLLTLW